MLDIILVNPGIGVSTSEVFSGLASKSNSPMPDGMPDPFNIGEWTDWIAKQRNDLEAPAKRLAPEIDAVLSALSSYDGCELARMSGSGATCFAIFTDADKRDAATLNLKAQHPSWWIEATDEAAF